MTDDYRGMYVAAVAFFAIVLGAAVTFAGIGLVNYLDHNVSTARIAACKTVTPMSQRVACINDAPSRQDSVEKAIALCVTEWNTDSYETEQQADGCLNAALGTGGRQ